jgi:hypothetical protein
MKNQKWTNFNDAEDQMSYELIPHKTIVKVVINVKRGGYITGAWEDGYATKSTSSNSVYLACEFVVIGGEYDNRKVWSNIGLYSETSDKYATIGRSTIKAILESANNLHPKDTSPQAAAVRNIKDFGYLNNLQVVAEIIINDKGQSPRNEIKTIITPGHPKYEEYMQIKNGRYKIDYGVHARPEVVLDNDEVPF